MRYGWGWLLFALYLSLPAQTQPVSTPARTSGTDGVHFSARDSLVLLLDTPEGDRGHLVGDARVQYRDLELTAYRIDLLFDQEELRATGLPVDTGVVGLPRFRQGNDTFTGRELRYNLRTERGRVVKAQTRLEDGYLQAQVVKVTEDSVLYVQDGTYSTCPCTDGRAPSYSLRTRKMKVEGRWIYTGPIQLYLFNIPTPIWLPFGFLPAIEGRRSGPLPVQYGEDERGFYLRGWGWYWAISDYMDLQIRGGIWTKGSWQISPLFRYAKRYAFSGQLMLDYLHNRNGEKGDPDFSITNTASFRWTHNQTLGPSANFSANVNLTTSNYLRAISERYDDRVRQTLSSSIRYSKNWSQAGRALNLSLSHQEVLTTGAVQLAFPQLSFSQRAFKPFRRSTGSRERWYERITVSYSGTLNNLFSFTPLPDETLLARGDTSALDITWYDALFSPSAYRRATGQEVPFQFRATHRVPVSASFSMRRLPLLNRPFPVTFSTSLNYQEDWFIRTERRRVDSTGRVITRSVPGFFALRQFSTGISASTTIYGLFPVRLGPFEGLRHTVRPSLSFAYRPDFSTDFWGYMRTYQDTTGRIVRYPIVSGVPVGRTQSLSFTLGNVFETKRVRTDTSGNVQRQTLQLLIVDLSTSYNFAADSLRLSTINISARTSALGPLRLTSSLVLSPYALTPDGRLINRYVLDLRRGRLARITSFRLSASLSLRSRTRQPLGEAATPPRARFGDPFTPDLITSPIPSLLDPTLHYADFSIPWSLNVNFSYSMNRPAQRLTRSAILNLSFDFNLTPKWKIQGRSGYDFVRQELATTSLFIVRDLGCWQMSLSWIPFGRYQSYAFELYVKSGRLRDLLRLRQPRSDIRGRFRQLR
ncbi:MAG: putative LPS assembly protein LptD [Rhodothermus sp.]|nr:putative LPS assembly protein LptD [Rhodothermus sp.]